MIKVICILFSAYLLQGILLGPTDDEAYYWVLAQHGHWGFAYHPPAATWLIAAFEMVFPQSIAYRVASAFLISTFVALSADFLKRKPWDFFSFAGLFGVGWMMVPDLPMLMGWILVLRGMWGFAQGEQEPRFLVETFLGVFISFLSKYSAPLVLVSLIWICFDKRFSVRGRTKILGVGFLGALIGLIPSVIHFSESGLGALAYQFSSRHDGFQFSFKRWILFVLSQLILVGPIVFLIWKNLLPWVRESLKVRFLFIFAVPASIFLVQPFFSEFKPHWAFVFWLPVFFIWLLRDPKWFHLGTKLQRVWGMSVLLLMIIGVHFPIISWGQKWLLGREPSPLIDISSDLHGWEHLPSALKNLEDSGKIPSGSAVLASRYQTAAQAAFALKDARRVTRVPLPDRERSDWSVSEAVDGMTEGWPNLLKPAIYVADERYRDPPQYGKSKCELADTIQPVRLGVQGKKIFIWTCFPI